MKKEKIHLPIQKAVALGFLSMNLKKAQKWFNLTYIVSPPGAGKTAIIQNMAQKANYGFLSYSPALERIEKFGGIPDIIKENNELRTIWSIPQMVTEINNIARKKEAAVVLFDDWHLCDEDLQSIGFELFTYFKLNNHPLEDNIVFMLAGNDSSAAGAETALSAIRNRCTMINTKPDIDFWIENFASKNNILPAGISFFQNKAMNGRFFHEQESTSEQFGSPRSWTSAFNYISELESLNPNSEPDYNLIRAIVEGSVSQEGAEAFMNYYFLYREIDLDEIFEKGNISIPNDIINKYAYSMAITNEAYNRICLKNNEENTEEIFSKFIKELYDDMKELCSAMIIYLTRIPKNEENISGSDIIKNMIINGNIDNNMFKNLINNNKSIS
jgi:hypothetical protein